MSDNSDNHSLKSRSQDTSDAITSKKRNKDEKEIKDQKRKHKNDSDSEDNKRDSDSRKRSKRRGPERDYDDKSRSRRPYKDLDHPQENYPRYYGDDEEKSKENERPTKQHDVGSRYYGDDYGTRKKSEDGKNGKEPELGKDVITPRQRKTVDLLTSKTGGAYIPPAKLRMMQAEITDKSSAAYQRIAWEALKKSIHGFINKVNTGNIGLITRDLLRENIVRGRGLLCKSLIQAQAASPTFTHVYAALVAVINSKFPSIGELLLRRLVLQFKRGFKRNDKTICISASAFVAHLVNQRVAHEILALEILTLLVETPTDDSVEVAIAFLKECGQKLTEVSSKGTNAIFEMLRNILHEGQLEKRIQYMIEVMFQVRKDGFKDHAAVIEELDIVEEEDQFTHLITLDEVTTGEDILNVFKFDDEYEENEGKYKTLSKEILGSDASGSEEGSGSEESGDSSDEDDDEEEKEGDKIIDNTETNLIALRRTIYLTIHSSLDFEECAHKLMKMQLKPGQEMELCHMFLDCCAEQRTYEKFYGLLAQRFCQINKVYIEPFQQIFKDTFATTHRLDTNRLRNVSKFFAHLLFTDAIGWEVLEIMKLNEEDTTSSSRIFIKILFQELCEYMGLAKLNIRLKDPTLQGSFAGLFPRDNPKNTRFAINFFTSIGLGGLTDELREHMKTVTKMSTAPAGKSSSSSSSSSSASSSSSSSSDSESSSSEEEDKKKKHKKKKENQKRKVKNSKNLKEKAKSKELMKVDEQKRQPKENENGRNREERHRQYEERSRNVEDNGRNFEQRKERNRNFKERNKNFEESSRNFEERNINEERDRNFERRGRNQEDRSRNFEDRGRNYEERSRNFEEKGRNIGERGRNVEERGRNIEERGRNFEEKGRNFEGRSRNIEDRSKNFDERGRNFEDKSRNYEERNRNFEERSRNHEDRRRNEDWSERREERNRNNSSSRKHSRSHR